MPEPGPDVAGREAGCTLNWSSANSKPENYNFPLLLSVIASLYCRVALFVLFCSDGGFLSILEGKFVL